MLYVLSTGYLDDFEIQGVFTTKEKAEEAVRLMELDPLDHEIQEFHPDRVWVRSDETRRLEHRTI